MTRAFLTGLCLMLAASVAAQTMAKGTVFHDRDENGVRNTGETGIEGVCVSNGSDVVQTDASGAWSLPVTDDAILFVIKPANWAVPTDANRVPKFYYIHKPNGSPATEPPGVAPTGSLPESIDFPLRADGHARKFSMIFFSDTQARGLKEVNYIAHDVVEELIGAEAAVGMSLGDSVADDPGLFDTINTITGRIGVPWYAVIGNHDTNRNTNEDRYSDETFERVYGPATYAFEYGDVVFIAFDDVFVKPEKGYEGRFTDDQLAFTRNYLATVPTDKLVVLTMHIPLPACKNARNMLALLEDRPHTFSISGHAHEQSHHFLGEAQGWHGAQPHHHFVEGAVCGSWWCGGIDECGIPHATMNDGVPNGYCIVDFDGTSYSIRFKAARRPSNYQMNVYLPDEIEAAQAGSTEVLVNVFAGSERSKVEMRADDALPWVLLAQTTGTDPQCRRMYEQSAAFTEAQEELLGWKMDKPSPTSHLWKGVLPADLAAGTHLVTVRTTDMFGQSYEAHRILRVK